MPKENFNVDKSKYILTPSKFSGHEHIFQEFKEILENSAAYYDPNTQVVVNGNTIYWNHSILELTASIPELKKFFGASKSISVKDNNICSSVNLIDITRTNDYRIQQVELLDEAQTFIDNFHYNQKTEFSEDMMLYNSTDELVTDLLSQSQGIVFGESHSDVSPKKFLMDNMSLFTELGVTTIYLEHIFSDTMQDLLDSYFDSDDDHMPVLLYHFLRELDRGNHINNNHYNFTSLVQSAKAHGIKIKAIDSIATWTTGNTGRGKQKISFSDRMYLMNYFAYRIMDQHIQNANKKDKCIIFCGNAHISSKTYSVPGIADLTDWPSINIASTAKKIKPLITAGSSIEEVNADYEIVMYPEISEEVKNQFNTFSENQRLYEDNLCFTPQKENKKKYPPALKLEAPNALIENLVLIKNSSNEFICSQGFSSKINAATVCFDNYCEQANKLGAQSMLNTLKSMKKEFSFLNNKSNFFDNKSPWETLLEKVEEIANKPLRMKIVRR